MRLTQLSDERSGYRDSPRLLHSMPLTCSRESERENVERALKFCSVICSRRRLCAETVLRFSSASSSVRIGLFIAGKHDESGLQRSPLYRHRFTTHFSTSLMTTWPEWIGLHVEARVRIRHAPRALFSNGLLVAHGASLRIGPAFAERGLERFSMPHRFRLESRPSRRGSSFDRMSRGSQLARGSAASVP